jgi:hypothetical protein
MTDSSPGIVKAYLLEFQGLASKRWNTRVFFVPEDNVSFLEHFSLPHSAMEIAVQQSCIAQLRLTYAVTKMKLNSVKQAD